MHRRILHYAFFFRNMYFFRSGKSNEQMPNYNDTRRSNFLEKVNNLQTGDSDSVDSDEEKDEKENVDPSVRYVTTSKYFCFKSDMKRGSIFYFVFR